MNVSVLYSCFDFYRQKGGVVHMLEQWLGPRCIAQGNLRLVLVESGLPTPALFIEEL
jgi:hypothetical protein